MQEKMDMASDETLETLEYLLNKFNVTIDVSKETLNTYVKEFCQKIVTYEIVMAILLLMLGVAMLVFSVYLFKKYKLVQSIKKYLSKDNDSPINEALSMRFALAIVLLVIGISVIIGATLNLTECFLFPEKTILDFLGKYI